MTEEIRPGDPDPSPPAPPVPAQSPPPDQPRGAERGDRPGDRRGDRHRGPRHRDPRGDQRRDGPRQEDRRGPPPRPPHPGWQKADFLARAVRGGIDREFIEDALAFSRSVSAGIASGQIRGIHGEVLRQEQTGIDRARLLLLKPRLAYLAARAGRSEARDLRAVLERGLDAVCEEGIDDDERRARFERFGQAFEAILIYHRVHEKKQGDRP